LELDGVSSNHFFLTEIKNIFLVVIPLQILDNIALIIIEENAPGSYSFGTWTNIFRFVDIICCGAILIPIIWSIKHLREASEVDGKAAMILKKLQLFRQFYLLVVAYIYFTRIIDPLVNNAVGYKVKWIGEFLTELASLVFFCLVGWKFRPASDNPYFQMPSEEEELEAIKKGKQERESDE